jgi:hypothetical protein
MTHTPTLWMVCPLLCMTAASAVGEEAAVRDVDLQAELQRSRPDYVVYVPKSASGSMRDSGNEHFLVFDGPDGSLMAVWTQSAVAGAGPRARLM